MAPNFLVMIVDQMNSFSLGWNGNPDVKTPNLDKLCSEGVNFGRAYTSNPVCQPSRATLHTGLTPRQHGLITNGCSLDEDIPTVTGVLADNGYKTHCVGKIHLQPFSTDQLNQAGAPVSWESRDHWNAGTITSLPQPFYGYQSTDYVGGHVDYVNGDYVNDVEAKRPGTKSELSRGKAYHSLPGSSAWRMEIPPEWHYNDWITERSIDFLKETGESRFFLVASFPDPHHPFCATRPYSEMYDPDTLTLPENWESDEEPCGFLDRFNKDQTRDWNEAILRESLAQTYGMITHIDDCVGRLLDALQNSGQAENTIVVFLSDHGDYLGSHHLLFKGVWPYEPVIRVPLVWKIPEGQEGFTCSLPVSHLDFVPTVLDYAGLNHSDFDTRGNLATLPMVLPGESLRAVIDSGASTQQEGKLVEFDEDSKSAEFCRYRMFITKRWKICIYGGSGDGLLYDLEKDPLEMHNLWHDQEYVTTKVELLAQLCDRLAQTDRLDNFRYCNA